MAGRESVVAGGRLRQPGEREECGSERAGWHVDGREDVRSGGRGKGAAAGSAGGLAAGRPGPAGIPSSPYRPLRIAWASSAEVATMWVAPASSSCSALLKPQPTLMQGISALAAVWTSTSESPT